MGKFCFPTNMKLKALLLTKSGIIDRYRLLQAYTAVLYCLAVAFILGIIYLVLVQYIPEIMISVSIVAGGVAMIILGITLLIY